MGAIEISSAPHHHRMIEFSHNPYRRLRNFVGTTINYAIPLNWPYDRPNTVDGGCGVGLHLRCFRNLDIPTWGLEIDPRVASWGIPSIRQYINVGSILNMDDIKKHSPRHLYTVDVLEHLNRKDINTFLEITRDVGINRMVHAITTVESPFFNLDRSHINGQTENEWRDTLNSRGWKVVGSTRGFNRRGRYCLFPD